VALHTAIGAAVAYVAWRWPVKPLVDATETKGWGRVLTWLCGMVAAELVLAIFGLSHGEFGLGGLFTFKRAPQDPSLPTAADLRFTLAALHAADTHLGERESEINGLLRDGLKRLRLAEEKVAKLEQRVATVEACLPPEVTGPSVQSEQ
jgi:hypothetical protein